MEPQHMKFWTETRV